MSMYSKKLEMVEQNLKAANEQLSEARQREANLQNVMLRLDGQRTLLQEFITEEEAAKTEAALATLEDSEDA